MRDCRNKYRELFQDMLIPSNDSHETTPMMWPSQGRPALLSGELTTELKVILNNLRTSGCAISRRVLIFVGNGVPEEMGKNGRNIILTVKWARRSMLKSMNWSKRRGTTAKIR